jgi:ankyrin repeat protein
MLPTSSDEKVWSKPDGERVEFAGGLIDVVEDAVRHKYGHALLLGSEVEVIEGLLEQIRGERQSRDLTYAELVKVLLSGRTVNGKDLTTALEYAALHGEPGGLEVLIRHVRSRRVLYRVASGGNSKAVKKIPKRDSVIADDVELLHAAIVHGHSRAIQAILDAGVDSRTLPEAAAYGFWDVVELLLRSGVDLDAQNLFGDTVLHVAVRLGGIETVGSLLKRGASCNIPNKERQTALHIAVVSTCSFEILKLLLDSGADILALDKAGSSILHSLEVLGSSIIFQYLAGRFKSQSDFARQDVNGDTALHLAAACCHCREVAEALVKCADFSKIRNKAGWTALHAAAANVHEEELPLLITLCKAGFDVNARDRRGQTALHIAAILNPSAVGSLVDLGADLASNDFRRVRPLDFLTNGKRKEDLVIRFCIRTREDAEKLIAEHGNAEMSIVYLTLDPGTAVSVEKDSMIALAEKCPFRVDKSGQYGDNPRIPLQEGFEWAIKWRNAKYSYHTYREDLVISSSSQLACHMLSLEDSMRPVILYFHRYLNDIRTSLTGVMKTCANAL